jgi:uncharacterized membrane protein HdeD (DUF308 family)
VNVELPPIVFYVLGAMFLVFGVLRAVLLGRRRAERELTEDTPERAKARKRHLFFGVLWVLVGVFLIVETSGLLRRHR